MGTIGKVEALRASFFKIKTRIVEESLLENMYGLEPLDKMMPVPVLNEEIALKNISSIGRISENHLAAQRDLAEFRANEDLAEAGPPHHVDSRYDMQLDTRGVGFRTPKPPRSGKQPGSALPSGVHAQSFPKEQLRLKRLRQMQTLYQSTPNVENTYWLKWNTFQVKKFNPSTRSWLALDSVAPPQPFLFFSSLVHLPKNLGMFILGGSDQANNFSSRCLFFAKYQRFVEKPPMLFRRAFFPSTFCILDSCVYVFGG